MILLGDNDESIPSYNLFLQQRNPAFLPKTKQLFFQPLQDPFNWKNKKRYSGSPVFVIISNQCLISAFNIQALNFTKKYVECCLSDTKQAYFKQVYVKSAVDATDSYSLEQTINSLTLIQHI